VGAGGEHRRSAAALEQQRASPAHARQRAAAARRRDQAQGEYVETFRAEVLAFLAFAPPFAAVAARLADAVTAHATPVGAGTVARTKRIPVERRAEAAVLAWLRHQTTGYDELRIARVKANGAGAPAPGRGVAPAAAGASVGGPAPRGGLRAVPGAVRG